MLMMIHRLVALTRIVKTLKSQANTKVGGKFSTIDLRFEGLHPTIHRTTERTFILLYCIETVTLHLTCMVRFG